MLCDNFKNFGSYIELEVWWYTKLRVTFQMMIEGEVQTPVWWVEALHFAKRDWGIYACSKYQRDTIPPQPSQWNLTRYN